MTNDVEDLVRKALELNEQDRAEVAARLLDSLEEDETVDSAWTTELERRARELETGEVEGIPWEEVRKRLLEKGDRRLDSHREDVQGGLRGKD